ncbi:N-acetylmuramoyl-L-alanine amidase [Burkholderia cenocepacia]|uniref:N-acetylmuramoyl-L-alanine amidase n=1 Tax=Burkholderia cenocepacia TaxID=95486 RepID=UPI000F5A20FC|nr:N-acetylmuramoyl-L-alanine amidase [Burkholderia cenocepacia]MBR8376531.1 N-acetylmuramoyl-L-alanine amidase [Burkholderia cenocepacia]MBR8410163.1 N-acetylmuramoyl-L-alanine amidase [Burkholderia cenocepacia]MDS0851676.1 N-acetylmuramoyl-L-alanine amidase [Burkholderia cenocepacia]RQV22598.1 N-acetylmuramoyl-L-alanine amidase [Burkholderia cenocepacia]
MTLFRIGACCAVFGLLAACTSPSLVERGTYYADTSLHARGADSRIRFLVMHYTESDETKSLRTLTGDSVSVHYVIPPQPRAERGMPVVYQLVPEVRRAWHAGVSEWQGTTELNAVSIGIENVNRGPLDPQQRTWQPYPPEQVDALTRLSKDIVARYGIPPTRVVGHSDIAPQRKIDPGPLFPWHALAQAGVGAWPDDATVAARLAGRDPHAPVDVRELQLKLARYGYDVPTDGVLDTRTRRVFAAFQMHFRPSDYAGNPDAESDAIAQALLDKYFPGTQAADPAPAADTP